MRSTQGRTRDGAKGRDKAPVGGQRAPKAYTKPELTSYGNLVELTRQVGGGDPDGLIGTIGT